MLDVNAAKVMHLSVRKSLTQSLTHAMKQKRNVGRKLPPKICNIFVLPLNSLGFIYEKTSHILKLLKFKT